MTTAQLRSLAKLAQTCGNGIIELTSRANVQLRGIMPDKGALVIKVLEQAGLAPKTPAGDGVRNVMVNPTAGFDGDDRIITLARDLSYALQTNPRSQTLSPKFSIFLDGGEACALINHINDIWLSLCDQGKNFAFGLASRPPLQGDDCQRPPSVWGKIPFFAAKGLVFALIDILLAMREQQPAIERMKHLLKAQGQAHLMASLRQKLPLIEQAEDFYRLPLVPHAHLGIHSINQTPCFYLGFKPPLGRLSPGTANFIADTIESANLDGNLRLTPWQSLIITGNGSLSRLEEMQRLFSKTGFITDAEQALAHIVCCVGAPGCRSARSPVRDEAQTLAAQLQGRSLPPLHITGCAKSCAANEAMAITLVATAPHIYDVFIVDPAAPTSFGHLLAGSVTIKQAANKLKHFLD